MKNIFIILTVFVLIVFHADILRSQQFKWETISSKLDVTSSAKSYDTVLFGTHGGLLSIDLHSFSMSSVTKTDGLLSQNITYVASGSDSIVWIGFYNGYIQILNIKRGTWEEIDDYRDHRITFLKPEGDSLFVGLDIGVSLYIITKKEVKETYRQLGNQTQRDVAVKSIALTSDYIWVATDFGISRAPISSANLMDPSIWHNFYSTGELDDNDIHILVLSQNKNVYAGSESGVYKWENNKWQKVYTGNILSIVNFNGDIYLTTSSGMYKWTDNQWAAISNSPANLAFLTSDSKKVWGVSGTNICSYELQSNSWNFYKINCMGSNLITSTYLDDLGREWVCSRGGGFFCKRDTGWVVFNRSTQPELLSNEIMCISEDNNNTIWVGTWGGGAYSVDKSDTLLRYHPKDGYLAGVSENHNYSVVTDILKDEKGDLWLLNYRAVNGYPLVCVHNGEWIYFGASEGINSTKLKTITYDNYGRKWIGSEDKGIFVLDDFGTVGQPQDDIVTNFTVTDGLGSNYITSIAGDRDGVMWVGTSNGLYSIYENSVMRRYGLISDNVKDVVVDGANNVWVGTDEGLNMFSQSEYKWYLFNQENSYLVSNDISSLFFHRNSGRLYISTSHGVSIINTPYSEPLDKLSTIRIYPNPFLPEKQQKVLIDGLAVNSIVAIYTTSGYLVKLFKEQQVFGRQVSWDGNDNRGISAASGVYIVVVKNDNGNKAAGKIALVR